jgi:adenine-specific DNA-methyltransferase
LKTSRNSDSEENLAQLEGRRLELQTALDAAKSQAERNRLGQFATPPALAREMLAFVRRLSNSEAIRFLDPAFGTGAFYYALLASVSGERIVAAEG